MADRGENAEGRDGLASKVGCGSSALGSAFALDASGGRGGAGLRSCVSLACVTSAAGAALSSGLTKRENKAGRRDLAKSGSSASSLTFSSPDPDLVKFPDLACFVGEGWGEGCLVLGGAGMCVVSADGRRVGVREGVVIGEGVAEEEGEGEVEVEGEEMGSCTVRGRRVGVVDAELGEVGR